MLKKYLFFLLSLLITINGPALALAASTTVYSSTAGEQVTVWGESTPNSWVPVKVLDSRENIVFFDSVRSDLNGSYTCTFKVQDVSPGVLKVVTGSGSAVAAAELTLQTPANTAPTAKGTVPEQRVTTGGSTGFTAYDIARDGNNDPLSITAIKTPPASTIATAVLKSGRVTITGLGEGNTAVLVTVSDGRAAVDVTVPITVTGSQVSTYTLTITAGEGGSITRGSSGSYAAGEVLALTAAPAAGYSFNKWTSSGGGTFANAVSAGTTFTMPARAVTITADFKRKSSGGSSNGGSNSNSSVAPPTYKAVVSRPGKAEASLPVNVNGTGGGAAVDLGALAGDVFTGGGMTVLTVPSITGVNVYTMGIPASALSGSQEAGLLNFSTGTGSITIPGNMLAGVGGANGKEAAISIRQGDKSGLSADVRQAIGDRPLVQLTLNLDGEQAEWNNPGVPVTVSIPYTPTVTELADPEHIAVWYIDGSGEVVTIPNGRYDPKTGTVIFTTTHLSHYAVAYVQKTFSDLGNVEWARKAIEVLASKGIINGTSKDICSPGANITRADYLALLVKTLGLTAYIDNNFIDVAPDAYYYEAVGIAKKLGIAAGRENNLFGPRENISRQDMMVMTVRALEKFKGLKVTKDTSWLNKFADRGDSADYAATSLATLVKEGLIAGSGNKLNPQGLTTRAEAAGFLYRIYNRFQE